MSRTSLMTVGLVLVLVGVQLNLVETLILTPTATGFLNERFTDPFETMPNASNANAMNNGTNVPRLFNPGSRNSTRNNYPFNTPSYTNRRYNAPTAAYTAGYSGGTTADAAGSYASSGYLGPQKTITPPPWLCWPVIFLGAVTFLYGAALGRD